MARGDRRNQRDDRRRSRSPPRRDRHDDRRRSRSPPRRDQYDDRRRSRSPPRDPTRGPAQQDSERGRPPPSGPRRGGGRAVPRDVLKDRSDQPAPKIQAPKPVEYVVAEDEDPEDAMMRVMGFKNFGTTKNKKIPGNDKNYAVFKAKKVEYRQYMNRVGGFNRALSPSR